MSRKEIALKNFEAGYNCCQSVLLTFAEDVGLDRGTAARLACGFGGGLSCTDNICGTAFAISFLISLKNGKESSEDLRTYELTRTALAEFKKIFNGRIMCTQLLGYNLSDQDAKEKAAEEQAYRICHKYIEKATEIAEKYLAMKKEK